MTPKPKKITKAVKPVKAYMAKNGRLFTPITHYYKKWVWNDLCKFYPNVEAKLAKKYLKKDGWSVVPVLITEIKK